MRGERYQNAMALLLVILVFASVPLIVNLPGLWFLWLPVLAAFAVLPAAFLREADLRTDLRAPPDIRDALVSSLRNAGAAATIRADDVAVRVNAVSTAWFRLRVTESGTVLSYETRPTRAAWALLAALVVSVIGSSIAIAVTMALVTLVRRFAVRQSHAAMAALGPTSTLPPGDDVRGLLVQGLSSALRTANEAYDAQRNAYTDAQVLVVIGAFVVWTSLLIGLFVILNGFTLLTGRWEIPIVGSTIAAILSGAAVLVALRRRYVPRLSQYRQWIERLGDAMARELTRTVAEPTSASTFELLFEVSTQVPDWLDAQRKAGLSADPRTGFAVLILTGFCASMIINAAYALFLGTPSAFLIYTAAAALFAGLAGWVTYRWRRRENARLAKSRSAWDSHVKTLRARMDRFLEEM